MTKDGIKSLRTLIDLGVERVLTSGLEPTVMEGIVTLKEMIKRSKR